MSTNRATKSGFAAEAQRKVSAKCFVVLIITVGRSWPGDFCDSVWIATQCYLFQISNKFEPYVMNNECVLLSNNRFFPLKQTRQKFQSSMG
jgi:hypothetical protein